LGFGDGEPTRAAAYEANFPMCLAGFGDLKDKLIGLTRFEP
jgi:hypothetical protein